jgi:hypothetical protein
LGDADDVERFAIAACARLNAPLEPAARHGYRLLPQHLPQTLRERLAEEAITKPVAVDFRYPPAVGTRFIHRSHPLVALLADHLLEEALVGDAPLAARAAVTVTADVETVTTLYLVRLRHHLEITHRRRNRQLMAEEAVAIGVRGRAQPHWLGEAEAAPLLDARPIANLDTAACVRELEQALAFLTAQQAVLERLAAERADALLADHRRVREASRDVGQYVVRPNLPVDVLGVYVLLPDAL